AGSRNRGFNDSHELLRHSGAIRSIEPGIPRFRVRALRAPERRWSCAAPSRALCREMIAVGLAQLDLAQLAGRGHRHVVEDADHLRHLEAAERLAAMLRYLGLGRLRARL